MKVKELVALAPNQPKWIQYYSEIKARMIQHVYHYGVKDNYDDLEVRRIEISSNITGSPVLLITV